MNWLVYLIAMVATLSVCQPCLAEPVVDDAPAPPTLASLAAPEVPIVPDRPVIISGSPYAITWRLPVVKEPTPAPAGENDMGVPSLVIQGPIAPGENIHASVKEPVPTPAVRPLCDLCDRPMAVPYGYGWRHPYAVPRAGLSIVTPWASVDVPFYYRPVRPRPYAAPHYNPYWYYEPVRPLAYRPHPVVRGARWATRRTVHAVRRVLPPYPMRGCPYAW